MTIPNTNKDDLEKMRKLFKSASPQEQKILDDSIEKEPESMLILTEVFYVFFQLLKDVSTGTLCPINQITAPKLQELGQSVSSSLLYSTRGNIRAGESEMRFAIEATRNLVYLLNDNNRETFYNIIGKIVLKTMKFDEASQEEILEKVKDYILKNPERSLKICEEINTQMNNLMHEYLESIDPVISKELKELKKSINSVSMHCNIMGSITSIQPTDFSDDTQTMDLVDSERVRERHLKKFLRSTATIIYNLYCIICSGLEKQGISMSHYREESNRIQKLLENKDA